jgi:hypothetical protein
VEVAGGRVAPGQVGYSDALVPLVPRDVTATSEAARRGLRVEFIDGTIVLSPDADDLVGLEIALLSGFEHLT